MKKLLKNLFGLNRVKPDWSIENMCMGTKTVGEHKGINYAGDKFMEHKHELLTNFDEHTYKPHNNEFRN